MKFNILIIFVLLICAYLGFVGYKVVSYNDNAFELSTWSLKGKREMKFPSKLADDDTNAPTKKGLMCRLEHVAGKTMNSNGENLIMNIKTPCTECNQFIYKNENDCITYEYDKKSNEKSNKEPIMGMCTPSKSMKAQECPFRKNKTSLTDIVPTELIRSVLSK
jgi:hypothetical protein